MCLLDGGGLTMAEHECFIGIYYTDDASDMVTLSALKNYIKARIEYNVYLKDLGIASCWLYKKEWSLRDYADKRKSTNLSRFDYCPMCGKKIDWAVIRRSNNV